MRQIDRLLESFLKTHNMQEAGEQILAIMIEAFEVGVSIDVQDKVYAMDNIKREWQELFEQVASEKQLTL